MASGPTFVAPPAVPGSRARPSRVCVCATASGPSDPAADEAFDQYEQYAARNKRALSQELSLAQALPVRQRHHQVFLQNQAEGPFRNAATRYITTLRESTSPSASRLWMLRSTADPTFGGLRGEPFPPRAMIVEPVSDGPGVTAWVSALDRAGRALSPMESHFVEWGVIGGLGTEPTVLKKGEVVATEVLNADWINPSSIGVMKARLLEHAEHVVDRGKARLFEVLQSVVEPTCFKTLEIYPSLGALQEHMLTLDPPFENHMLECRAAVNRVRQLYIPLFSLHE